VRIRFPSIFLWGIAQQKSGHTEISVAGLNVMGDVKSRHLIARGDG